MGTLIDRRWLRLTALCVLVAAACYSAGSLAYMATAGLDAGLRQWIAVVIALCGLTAGFAWVVVKAFDAFGVDELRNRPD